MWPSWTAFEVKTQRGGVGPRRLKRMKRVSRREIQSVDQPYCPRACEMSQSLPIVRSRVKPPSVHGSAWRVASSIPRTSRGEAERDRLFVFVLFQSSDLPNSYSRPNRSKHRTAASVDRVPVPTKNEDAGVPKIIPSPVLLAP